MTDHPTAPPPAPAGGRRESPEQSTAGNNMLSRDEYDALLSHLSAYTRCALGTATEISDPWRSVRPGEPVTAKTIDAGLSALSRQRILSGSETEAARIMAALRSLFGRPPRLSR